MFIHLFFWRATMPTMICGRCGRKIEMKKGSDAEVSLRQTGVCESCNDAICRKLDEVIKAARAPKNG